MNTLVCWINERLGFATGERRRCGFWPCLIAFAFCVQAISGFFLWAYYSPSSQTAWESVYYLQNHVAAGWLVRAIHHYSAHALLAVLIIYVLQYIFSRMCRPPRELVFWTALGLGMLALAAVLTGDLLAWDQNGYAATKTRVGFMNFLPLIGEPLWKLAVGGPGPALGSLTLTRFFALHVGLFGGGFLLLLFVHRALIRRADGLASAPLREKSSNLGLASCAVLMIVVILLACLPAESGAPLLSPADTDPANQYAAARPEWFLTGVYEFSHLPLMREYPIVPIFIVPGLVLCVLLAVPFLAKYAGGHLFNVVFTVALLVAVAGLTWHSLAEDRSDSEYAKAVAMEKRTAERLDELIRHEGIPPTGALALLRNDPKTQGPRLFAEQCASCHDHTVAGGNPLEEIRAAESSAPNLGGFASRRWIAGLLDPKRVAGPDYFGGTKFRGGRMVGFVKEVIGEMEEDEMEEIDKIVAALSAEAGLPGQREIDARDAKIIAEGRKLIADDFGCTDCHSFRGKGASVGPNLTGYGSAEWISGIVCDPAAKRYYGESNDRMPAYAPSADDPAQNTLTRRQIELLADWLRGQWYVEKPKTSDFPHAPIHGNKCLAE